MQILIIDFGSQTTQLIARRIRQLKVYCEIYPHSCTAQEIIDFKPQGIILSGGPYSVYQSNAPHIPALIFNLAIPILGICYGMQIMAQHLGGNVEPHFIGEFGSAMINNCQSPLLLNLDHNDNHKVWMSHGDQVNILPPDFTIIARTNSCPIAAMANLTKNYYGLQFHPELTHTTSGQEILRRFVLEICNITPIWTIDNYTDNLIAEIRTKVQDERVILALSGGVDSTVSGVLIQRAIGERLICIFVDTGLLRYDEAIQIMNDYQQHLGLKIIKIDAAAEFYQALVGIIDPEAKRKIIGKLFIDIFIREAKKIKNIQWLAQGTIYPDIIESTPTNGLSNIKSHHNVGGLPQNLGLKLLEPLAKLFKDEVRTLGLKLGIADQLIYRHPFPGPGLAVRILGEVRATYIPLLQLADHIFIEELRIHNLYYQVAQAFAVFVPVKTVGVMGDHRTYDYLIVLRAVNTDDFMSASVADLPHELITKVANRIINEVPQINRVCYDVSSKPPATIEWE